LLLSPDDPHTDAIPVTIHFDVAISNEIRFPLADEVTFAIPYGHADPD
jgi:hypothetical protein